MSARHPFPASYGRCRDTPGPRLPGERFSRSAFVSSGRGRPATDCVNQQLRPGNDVVVRTVGGWAHPSESRMLQVPLRWILKSHRYFWADLRHQCEAARLRYGVWHQRSWRLPLPAIRNAVRRSGTAQNVRRTVNSCHQIPGRADPDLVFWLMMPPR